MKLTRFLGILLVCLYTALTTVTSARAREADTPLALREIRYRNAEAGEVSLVWGINGWKMVPEVLRPLGTTLLHGQSTLMRTPMLWDHGTFIAKVQVPIGATIDYMFYVSKTRSNVPIDAWDMSSPPQRQFSTIADEDGVTTIDATILLAQQAYTSQEDSRLQLMGIFVLAGSVLALAVVVLRIYYRNPYLDF